MYRSEQFYAEFIDAGRMPQCPACGGIIKPNVILFGEALPVRALMAAKRAVAECDVLLIAGSSLEVAPASDLPMLARSHQARLIIDQSGPHVLDDYLRRVHSRRCGAGPAGDCGACLRRPRQSDQIGLT